MPQYLRRLAAGFRADIAEATEESMEDVLRTNLVGPFFLTQLVARYWLAQRMRAIQRVCAAGTYSLGPAAATGSNSTPSAS